MSPSGFNRALALLAALGCNSQPTEVPSILPSAPLAAVGKEVAVRARYSWADTVDVGPTGSPQWVTAGFQGDGRLRDGTPGSAALSNEYQGDYCGVNAVIGSGARGTSTNLNYDPDFRWSDTLPALCSPSRHYRVYLDGLTQPPRETRPTQIVSDIASMTVGETRIQPFKTGTLTDLSVGLQFDDAYPPSSSVLVVRLPDILDQNSQYVRQWRVQSRGTHKAAGFVSGKKGQGPVPNGSFYYVPFSLTVTEVR